MLPASVVDDQCVNGRPTNIESSNVQTQKEKRDVLESHGASERHAKTLINVVVPLARTQ